MVHAGGGSVAVLRVTAVWQNKLNILISDGVLLVCVSQSLLNLEACANVFVLWGFVKWSLVRLPLDPPGGGWTPNAEDHGIEEPVHAETGVLLNDKCGKMVYGSL